MPLGINRDRERNSYLPIIVEPKDLELPKAPKDVVDLFNDGSIYTRPGKTEEETEKKLADLRYKLEAYHQELVEGMTEQQELAEEEERTYIARRYAFLIDYEPDISRLSEQDKQHIYIDDFNHAVNQRGGFVEVAGSRRDKGAIKNGDRNVFSKLEKMKTSGVDQVDIEVVIPAKKPDFYTGHMRKKAYNIAAFTFGYHPFLEVAPSGRYVFRADVQNMVAKTITSAESSLEGMRDWEGIALGITGYIVGQEGRYRMIPGLTLDYISEIRPVPKNKSVPSELTVSRVARER